MRPASPTGSCSTGPSANAGYTPEETGLLALLAPHVMEALVINRKMHLERLGPAEQDAAPRGSAIADLRGVVYHADARFAALAGEEWDDWQERRLPAALASHFQGDGERFRGRAVVVDARVEQTQPPFLEGPAALPRRRPDGARVHDRQADRQG